MDFKAFAETNARQEFPAPVQVTHWTQPFGNGALPGATRLYRAACGLVVPLGDLAAGEAPTCPECRQQYDEFEATPF